jgi:anti-sigma B factor antagonist
MSLRLSSRLVGDVLVLDLSGRITLGEGSTVLRDSIKKVVAEGQKKILLNIGDVNYIDSSGVCVLAMAAIEPRQQGGCLKLLNPTKKVHDLLQITKLYSLFEIFTDENIALESFIVPELRCCCPLCGFVSGPPILDGKLILWPPQVCRNARCEARFTIVPSGSKTQALVRTVRIQTYKDEYFELQTGPFFNVKIVGRLDLFSSPALKKSWQPIPVPRRVLFDLSATTEIDDAGREALEDLLAKRGKDESAVVSLEGLGSEQKGMFPNSPPFYQNRATALAALGDVSDSPPLHARVLNE